MSTGPGNPEDLLAFEEERPQFRVRDRESLVDLDLLAIGFDLREVGVVGEVEREVRGEAVLHADAAFLDVVGPELAAVVFSLPPDRRERRQQFEVAAASTGSSCRRDAHLAEVAHVVARHRRPDVVLVLASISRSIWKPQRCASPAFGWDTAGS